MTKEPGRTPGSSDSSLRLLASPSVLQMATIHPARARRPPPITCDFRIVLPGFRGDLRPVARDAGTKPLHADPAHVQGAGSRSPIATRLVAPGAAQGCVIQAIGISNARRRGSGLPQPRARQIARRAAAGLSGDHGRPWLIPQALAPHPVRLTLGQPRAASSTIRATASPAASSRSASRARTTRLVLKRPSVSSRKG